MHQLGPIKEALIDAQFRGINVAVVSLEKEIPDNRVGSRPLQVGRLKAHKRAYQNKPPTRVLLLGSLSGDKVEPAVFPRTSRIAVTAG